MPRVSHVDSAIRTHDTERVRIRTDLSATLFPSAPDEYDGGELLIEEPSACSGSSSPADPWCSIRQRACIGSSRYGAARASFFWTQSLVRHDARRALLFDLDMAIIRLTRSHPGDPALVALVGVYHDLLRMWAEP